MNLIFGKNKTKTCATVNVIFVTYVVVVQVVLITTNQITPAQCDFTRMLHIAQSLRNSNLLLLKSPFSCCFFHRHWRNAGKGPDLGVFRVFNVRPIWFNTSLGLAQL